MAVEERGFVKAISRAARRARRGGNNDWIAPLASRHPSTTRTIIIVCVVIAVALLLALLGWLGYRKWASRKQKRKTPLAVADEAAETDHDNPRPVLANVASSKSRKQAAAASWEP